MNAIVFQEMREARGLAYSASAYYASPSRTDDPSTSTPTSSRRTTRWATASASSISCSTLFPSARLPSKWHAESDEEHCLFPHHEVWHPHQLLVQPKRGLNYDLRRTIYEQLPKITLRDLVEFEKEYMAEKPYRYIILGDEKELDMDLLQKIGPIKRLSTEEIFGY